ncbi:MAG: relaxase/mobilization nuclease domain-containing protein, partial [Bacteroidales bacterium]|nr:relaxase/mobilization nuclease domain-containing protein [Bacteroidales bacterium]
PKVSKPVGHIAISFKPEDKPRLTNEFMVQIAKEYMEKMGIKDTQYVIVRHHNTPNPHCHLIFNRVDNNGKRISDSNWLKRNVRVCKELKQKYGLTFGEGKSQTRTERLRPNERTRYEMANDVKSALKDSHSWKDFSNHLKTYGINAQIKSRSSTHIPQGISFTRDGTTFKGSSLDLSLSFNRIDKVLTGGMNIDSSRQEQDHTIYESHSPEQTQSLTSDLANIASELAIGLIASGQEKKSEEQDLTPNKKRGPRL